MKYEVNRNMVQWSIVDGEAVIVNVETTYYYGLNRTGTFVWSLLAEAERTAEELAERMSERFDVGVGQARPDVEAVLEMLVKENLIKEG